MSQSLEGRTAIVTGAASGVGRAAALRLGEAGARLLVTDRDADALDATAREIVEDGGDARAWCCDLRQKLGVANLLASATDHFGGVDILVNAAAAPFRGAPLEAEVDTLDEAYAQNLRSVFLLCQAAARRMVQARRADPDAPAGAIVNVTSTAAQRTNPALLPFSVTSAALDQMTRSLAVALAEDRVRVNGVALGAVMTRGLAGALRDRDGLRADLVRATPMRRIGEAAEAAEAILFLASPSASFVTGQILAVDGGRMVLDPLATPTE